MAGKLQNLASWLIDTGAYSVILVHDVRDDETSVELKKIIRSSKNSNIEFIEGFFGSPGIARNQGLRMVLTEWVCFWDSDDLPNIKGFEKLISLSGADDEVLIGNFIEANIETLDEVLREVDKKNILSSIADFPGIWRMVFRSSTLIDLNFSDHLMGEDQLFLLNYRFAVRKLHHEEIFVYKYFKGFEGQLTSNPKALASLEKTLLETSKFLKDPMPAQRYLGCRFFVRQSITYGKYAPNKQLKIVIRSLLFGIQTMPGNFLNFIRALIHVLWFKNTNKGKQLKNRIILNGGLGNQLFQLAFLLHISQGRDAELEINSGNCRSRLKTLPDLGLLNLPATIRFVESKELSRLRKAPWSILLRISSRQRPENLLFLLRKSGWFLANLFTSFRFARHTLLLPNGLGFDEKLERTDQFSVVSIGYFQSYIWSEVPHVKENLSELSPKKMSERAKSVLRVAQNVNPTIVHLRFGDYQKESNFGILPINYYKSALQELAHKGESINPIWVFSDDEKLARAYFSNIDSVAWSYIETADLNSAEIMEILKYGSAYIIANSTFSYWAAYLRKSSSAPVYAPSPWFRNLAEPEDLFPKNWNLINPWFKDVSEGNING